MKSSPWRPPGHLWRLRLRRSLGRSRFAQFLKGRRAARRRSVVSASAPHRTPEPRSSPDTDRRADEANVLLISHCDFTGNSGLSVYAMATDLSRRGFSVAIAIPGNVKSVRDLGQPTFPVASYRDVTRGRLRFSNGRGLELIHAFTPREPVRRLVTELVHAHSCRYVVHLEDNESAIIGGRSDPARTAEFLSGAAGVTVAIDRLLELKPADVPGAVVWPGFDEAILSPRRSREEVRRLLAVEPSDVVIVYPGNIHASNLEDVQSLYRSVQALRSSGYRAVLVKTGWDFVHRSSLPSLGSSSRELGWVAREHVPELLSAADVLVQPGRSDPYNDYRFPSKLPEFLASGRPVVLPRTNIGLGLRDGQEALLLQQGSADEISRKVAALIDDAELRAVIGEGGRAFALRELRWSKSVDAVVDLYLRLRGAARP